MAIERTSALILRKIPHSETSEILTVISPESGKLTLIAKGSQRQKSPFAGILIPFQRLQLDYYFKSTRMIQNLKEASIDERFSNIQNNLEHSVVANVLSEITLKTIPENTDIKDKFSFFLNALRHLNKPCNYPSNTLIRFWLRWLDLIGYRPNFCACEHCKNQLFSAHFSSHGETLCQKCTPKTTISQNTLTVLRDFQNVKTSQVDSQTSKQFIQEGLDFLTLFSKFHIESVNHLKSLVIYRRMFA